MLRGLVLLVFLASLARSDPLPDKTWAIANTSQTTTFNYILDDTTKGFELQVIRTSTLNKTKPTPSTYSISIRQISSGSFVGPNSTYGFLAIPVQPNSSNKETYEITIKKGHEHFIYSLRVCQGTCNTSEVNPCLLFPTAGNDRISCEGNGACNLEKATCTCDHMDWEKQIEELPASLRWIAEFLGHADAIFNTFMWKAGCEARENATKVIENLKLSLVIFITVVAATIILLIGLTIGICCCCCRGKSCCCGKKDDQSAYSPLNQGDDYDLDAMVDAYDEQDQ